MMSWKCPGISAGKCPGTASRVLESRPAISADTLTAFSYVDNSRKEGKINVMHTQSKVEKMK